MIGKINYKRIFTVLIIFSLGTVFGIGIGKKLIFSTLSTDVVKNAVNKPTQVSTTNNSVNIRKVKKADTLTIDFKPNIDQSPTQIITNKDCKDLLDAMNNLSDNKKKRVNRLLGIK